MQGISLTNKEIRFLLKERNEDSHKGNYGHALLVAGKAFCMGAALISAHACLRSGVGLLTVNVPASERLILQTALPEAMLVPREEHELDLLKYDALGVGPGLSTQEDVFELLTQLIKLSTRPMVLDADALNMLAQNQYLVEFLSPQTIITPHPKEFDRLFGIHTSRESRILTAIEKAKSLNLVVVLKGHRTIITDGDSLFINTTGNAGLAKGGSGDALTGIITSFLAQKYSPLVAAQLGVYLHGLAADIAIQSQSKESVLITDIIGCLGEAFNSIRKSS